MATLDEISKEKQRVSEALARVDAQREKLAGRTIMPEGPNVDQERQTTDEGAAAGCCTTFIRTARSRAKSCG
jgi:hypothetical protein